MPNPTRQDLLSRRSFVWSLFAAAAAPTALRASARPSAQTGWVLLGNGHGPGVFRARWNASHGQLGTPELAVETHSPSYLCSHGSVVYACNELDTPAASISAFRLDRNTAALTLIDQQPTQGSSPCYVSVDRAGQRLFAANYGGGSLSTFALGKGGELHPDPSLFTCAGNPLCGTHGPQTDRQEGPHFHCAILSPDGRYLVACDLGDDSLFVFPLTPGPGTPVRIATAPGAGPRHVAFHPHQPWMYCINELGCNVVPYHWQPGNGATLRAMPGAEVSVLPHGAAHTGNTAAEIVLTQDGRFAYTSTRGAEVLTVFRIDPQSGHLTPLQQLPCGGKTPRFIALDPTERWLLCANQDGNTITLFARDSKAGQLTPHGNAPATNPQCILWV